MRDPLVLQFWAFLIKIPLEDLQHFAVIFLVGGHLWWHKVLIKTASVVSILRTTLLPYFREIAKAVSIIHGCIDASNDE